MARLLSSKGQDNGLREVLWNCATLYGNIIENADPNAIFQTANPPKPDAERFVSFVLRGVELPEQRELPIHTGVRLESKPRKFAALVPVDFQTGCR